MADLKDLALNAITSYQMIKNGDIVIVACSGGADSVALLHFLFTQAGQLGIIVRAAHVDHGLRGAQSAADADFVRALCKKMGVPLDEICLAREEEESAGLPLPSSQGFGVTLQRDAPAYGSEAWARQKRYAFFETLAVRYGAKIATAHTQNDAAETVLFNLARGAGLHGASGIPAVRGCLIRPLLTVTRQQVEEYDAENGLAYVTDATNATQRYARNRVRHTVLPALETVHPGAQAALTRFAGHAAQAADYLDAQAEELLKTAVVVDAAGESAFQAQALCQAHPAPRAAALRQLIAPYADPTLPRLSAAEAALFTGGAVQLGTQTVLVVRQGLVRLTTVDRPPQASWSQPFQEGTCPMPDGKVLVVALHSYEEFINFEKAGGNPLKYVADYDKITSNATFRTRMAGDRFAVQGLGHTRPLKKLYSEARLSDNARAQMPLLAAGSRVLWCACLGFAAGLAPDAKTEKIVTIECVQHCGATRCDAKHISKSEDR